MRRFIRDRRGQIRVIEALFASILMLASLALIPVAQHATQDANGTLSSTARDILAGLDGNGELARVADQQNWTAMQRLLEVAVPSAMWFNLTVLDESGAPINSVPICSGGAISDHIEAADYLCATTNANYAIYLLRLQLSGLD